MARYTAPMIALVADAETPEKAIAALFTAIDRMKSEAGL